MPAAEPVEPWIKRSREQVGDRIRSLRRGQRITQDALGEAVGVDRKTISRWENGHHPMDIDQAHQIARALAVPPAWLFSDDWSTPDVASDASATPSTPRATPTPGERHGNT
jgi:transcriptional regulator with XRE-family HTH domain